MHEIILASLNCQPSMEINFHPHIKNRSHRSENMYVAAGTHLTSSFVQPLQNVSSSKPNQAALILAYLVLEKNVRLIAQSIKKLAAKQKRLGLRKIAECSTRGRQDKNSQWATAISHSSKGKKEQERTTVQCVNPELNGKQLQIICQKQVCLTLQKAVTVLETRRTQSLLLGWSSLQNIQRTGANDFAGGYELQMKGGNNGSRISNKRKSTRAGKTAEQVKQNSNCNGSEFSLQNQRLRNQLLGQDFQREQFAEKMHELLEQHEKYLLQGSTTTRGSKKQR